MPYVGILRAAALAKESSVGTLNSTPDIYIPYIPPDNFSPDITTLESAGIRFKSDKVIKATQGPAVVKGGKLKCELEPENVGEMLMATFGQDSLSGTALTGYTHTFTRLSTAQLPTYTVWLDKGVKYPQFKGSMLNKLDIESKVKEYVTVDSDWTALAYDDTGTSKSPTYSPYKAFVFNEVAISVDGSPVYDYDNLKISVDNMVHAEHALSGSIYTSKIWTEGMRVTLSADLYVENATQWNKFLAGTTASFNIVLTSSEDIPGTSPAVKFALTIDIPVARYLTAPFYNPTGPLKIPFTAVAVYDTVSTKTISMALLNSKSSVY